MSNSIPPVRWHWQSGPMGLALLLALAPLVAAQHGACGGRQGCLRSQSEISEYSPERITLLKRAVVIVTTVDREGKPILQGSGFFIAADRVVTNMHVIKDADRIRIQAFDGYTNTVRNVVAVDEQDDLALLQMEAPNLGATILKLADSAPVEGEAIVLMSNPRDCQWKLTHGEVGPIWKFKGTGKRIQITALIYPGSSGGPVVNKQGHVVGIAVMHFEGSDDLNFAVPAQRLKALQASISIASLYPAVSAR